MFDSGEFFFQTYQYLRSLLTLCFCR